MLSKHNYYGIDATIIADSLNEDGDRITTFVLSFPRYILAELNTHRVFSRNSASSRAIPFKKMVKVAQEHPFVPIAFQKDHSGMQGNEYLTGEQEETAIMEWYNARDWAVESAKRLHASGVTKQICNRVLEPYLWHTAIVTATDFENWFALRAHPDAEIHIAKLAETMLEKYNESEPKLLMAGEWHIPFGDEVDYVRLGENTAEYYIQNSTEQVDINKWLLQVATARCARVSYMNFEGTDDYAADFKLHDRLASMGHWSPFEHCAQALATSERSGNFTGFQQYRKLFEGENKTDSRVIHKTGLGFD